MPDLSNDSKTLTRDNLVDAALSVSGLGKLIPGGGAGGGAAKWFLSAADANLVGAYDVRGVVGGSAITEDADPAVSVISDLSGQGNDCTHWRGTGLNNEKASLGASAAAQGKYLNCAGFQSGGNEEHWGHQDGQIEETLTEWHWFSVIRCHPDQVLSQASTSTGARTYKIPASSGTNGRPSLGIDSVGGSGSGGAWNTTLDGGGGQLGSGSAGASTVNLESLAGRAETDAANRVALVEWRYEGNGGLQQVWVNGFLIGEQDPCSITGDTMNYCLWGKQDLNNNAGGLWLFAVALGVPGKSGRDFTVANAATIRAGILADFGIETWDGSTYPT